ncbi:hypothetical protein G7054_g1767 [Neopestalotiopsis clavispora]|nr:hypothetical protein G7054_g1767 [Neopestalotiopsis clavispora]
MPIISLPDAANGLIQVVFDDATPLTAYHVSIMARGGGSLNLDTTSILDLARQSNAGFVRVATAVASSQTEVITEKITKDSKKSKKRGFFARLFKRNNKKDGEDGEDGASPGAKCSSLRQRLISRSDTMAANPSDGSAPPTPSFSTSVRSAVEAAPSV